MDDPNLKLPALWDHTLDAVLVSMPPHKCRAIFMHFTDDPGIDLSNLRRLGNRVKILLTTSQTILATLWDAF